MMLRDSLRLSSLDLIRKILRNTNPEEMPTLLGHLLLIRSSLRFRDASKEAIRSLKSPSLAVGHLEKELARKLMGLRSSF